MAFSSRRFFEEENLPDDATVVAHIWRFSRADGSPDPRYKKDNVAIPIVLYRLLVISAPSLPKVCLEVSDRRAAACFASTFGAEVSTEEPKENKAGHRKEHRRADKDSGRSSSKEGRAAPFRRDYGERPGSPRRDGLSGCRRERG